MKKFLWAAATFLTILGIFQTASAQVSQNYWLLSSGTLKPILSTWTETLPYLGGGGAGCVSVTNAGLLGFTSCGGGGTVTSVTGTYPIISSGGATPAISTAFGTTTTNVFNALNTFGNATSTLFTSTTAWIGTLNLTNALTVANGGTGAQTLTGLLQGNGTGAITGVTGTTGQFPYYNGTNTLLATSSIQLSTKGYVGIGTAATAPLHVSNGIVATPVVKFVGTGVQTTQVSSVLTLDQSNDGSNWLNFSTADSLLWSFVSNGNDLQINQQSPNKTGLIFKAGGTAGPKFGMGTQSPYETLEISSTTAGVLTDALGLRNANTADLSGVGLFFAGGNASGVTRGARISSTNQTNSRYDLQFWVGAGPAIPSIAMTLTGDQYLGLGTTTPESKFEITSNGAATDPTVLGADSTMIFQNTATNNNSYSALAFRTQDLSNGSATTSSQIVGIHTSHVANLVSGNLAFYTENAGSLTEKMRILANGNVGIGTTTPGSLFSVNGILNLTAATSTFYSTGGINLASGCFAIAGTCVGGGGGGIAWPFTPSTYAGVANQSTTTNFYLPTAQIIASSTYFTQASTTLFTIAGASWLGTPSQLVGTNISGTAASLTAGAATVLATARAINGVSFDGSAPITINAASSTLLVDKNAFTGTLNTFANSTSTLGTITTAWIGTLNLTNALTIGNGGTGLSAIGASSTVLTTNGTLAAWQKIDVGGAVYGVLSVANGGTGAATLTGCLTGNGAGAITGSGTCNTSNATVSSVAGGNGLNGGTITTSGTLYLKSYTATSTADTTGQVLVFTSTNANPATFGGDSDLTFTLGNLLTATNASTTNFTALTSAFFATTTFNNGIILSATQPATSTPYTLNWGQTGPQVELQIGTAAFTINIINATTSQFWGSRKLVWVCNPVATAGALTWTGVEWVGTAPTQTTTANQCDYYSFNIIRATSTTAYKVAGVQGAGFQ